MVCPVCLKVQSETIEQVYIRQNDQCRDCDIAEWKSGRMTTHELERRESQAQTEAERGAGEK